MLRLNFHHLYYFYLIAREGQVARAARRLRIGQPTLSTQLKQFEDHLGYRLFERKRGQTISLTKRGEILFHYAREIFRLSDEMLAAAQGKLPDGTLQLRLGVLDWLPKEEVSRLVGAVVTHFDCYVSVHEDTSVDLLRSLADHQFDLVVTNAPAAFPEIHPFRTHRIAVLPVEIYGVPKFSKLRAGFPGSLQDQPFIFPSPHGKTRHLIDDYFRSNNIRVKPLGEAQDGELLRRAALSGTALVPLSPSTIAAEVKHGDLISVGKLAHVTEEFWLVSALRYLEHPVVAYLMNQYGRSQAA